METDQQDAPPLKKPTLLPLFTSPPPPQSLTSPPSSLTPTPSSDFLTIKPNIPTVKNNLKELEGKTFPFASSSSSSIDFYQVGSSSGKLRISPELTFDFTSEDLEDLGEIGRGAYGTVNKMRHNGSQTLLAVKRIRLTYTTPSNPPFASLLLSSTVDSREQKKLMMDLDVIMKSNNNCPFIVQFYGAIFKEGDCWICMELMDSSLDQFYKFVYKKRGDVIPESVIGKIAIAVVNALNYLHVSLKIIHRDIKPSNILLDRSGAIKLCDFGISGQLVDSIAQSRDAGCRPYMAPERIDPSSARGYDIRSDVWSLGITLYEISTGTFPYPKWNSIFEQLCQVVEQDPPQLKREMDVIVKTDKRKTVVKVQFSQEFVQFVNTCLIKDELQRPKYSRLLQHPFLLRSENETVNVKDYFTSVFDSMGELLQQRLENLTLVNNDDD